MIDAHEAYEFRRYLNYWDSEPYFNYAPELQDSIRENVAEMRNMVAEYEADFAKKRAWFFWLRDLVGLEAAIYIEARKIACQSRYLGRKVRFSDVIVFTN